MIGPMTCCEDGCCKPVKVHRADGARCAVHDDAYLYRYRNRQGLVARVIKVEAGGEAPPVVVAEQEPDDLTWLTKELKDSGKRREFSTGSVRDDASHKPRFDLMGMHGLVLYGQQLRRGCKIYGDRNWEKGQPTSVLSRSAFSHLAKFIAGYDDEPHLDAAIWNLMAIAEILERIRQGILPAELDDLPKTFAGKSPDGW